jgi:hypothetical protein
MPLALPDDTEMSSWCVMKQHARVNEKALITIMHTETGLATDSYVLAALPRH